MNFDDILNAHIVFLLKLEPDNHSLMMVPINLTRGSTYVHSRYCSVLFMPPGRIYENFKWTVITMCLVACLSDLPLNVSHLCGLNIKMTRCTMG